MTIISLHLPKTAGTSFAASLSEHFGERYCRDYGDQGIAKPMPVRCRSALSSALEINNQGLEGIGCVHGHFLPLKYLLLSTRQPLTFITWMRDPVARMLSHYYFWQATYDASSSAPHHRRVIEECWTLEKFCLSEQFRNIYTQYLWGFPLKNFAFIGISEHYEAELQYFAQRYLCTELLLPHRENSTSYAEPRKSLDRSFLDQVRAFHASDMHLYHRALELRSSRVKGPQGRGHIVQMRERRG